MASSWPTSVDNFGQVTGTEATNHPNTAGLTHAQIHNLLADAVTALETNLTPSSGGGQLPIYTDNSSGGISLTESGSGGVGLIDNGGGGAYLNSGTSGGGINLYSQSNSGIFITDVGTYGVQ